MIEKLGIPEKYRTVVILGIIAFFLILVILLINAISRAKMSNIQEINNMPESAQREYDLNRFKKLASNLERAFMNVSSGDGSFVSWTAGFGTNTKLVYEVFNEIQNLAELEKLIIAYGKRKLDYTSGYLNLMESIDYELDDSEILKVNQILKNKNINFKFFRS